MAFDATAACVRQKAKGKEGRLAAGSEGGLDCGGCLLLPVRTSKRRSRSDVAAVACWRPASQL